MWTGRMWFCLNKMFPRNVYNVKEVLTANECVRRSTCMPTEPSTLVTRGRVSTCLWFSLLYKGGSHDKIVQHSQKEEIGRLNLFVRNLTLKKCSFHNFFALHWWNNISNFHNVKNSGNFTRNLLSISIYRPETKHRINILST